MYAKLFEWRETTTTTPRRYTRCCCCCCCCCKNLLVSVVTSPSYSNLHGSAASSSLSQSSHTNSSFKFISIQHDTDTQSCVRSSVGQAQLDVSRHTRKHTHTHQHTHKHTFTHTHTHTHTRHTSTPHVAGDDCVHEVRVRPARFDLRLNIDPRLVVVFFRRRGPSEVQQMTLKRPSHFPRRRVLPSLKFTPSERHDVAATIVVSTPLMLSPRREERTTTTTTLLFFFILRVGGVRTPTPSRRLANHDDVGVVFSMK